MAEPIKRSDHIMQLSREHHFSLLFCWKVRKGIKNSIEQDRIIDYILYFWKGHLLPHFAEEDILFEPVEDSFVQRAYAEHNEINATFRRLSTATEEEKTTLIPYITDLLESHVRFEERELFPHLEQSIPESQLAIIGKKLAEAQPEALQDDYEDQFWK